MKQRWQRDGKQRELCRARARRRVGWLLREPAVSQLLERCRGPVRGRTCAEQTTGASTTHTRTTCGADERKKASDRSAFCSCSSSGVGFRKMVYAK